MTGRNTPVGVKMTDGSNLICLCGSSEFRPAGKGALTHLFCRCGRVYTERDLLDSAPDDSLGDALAQVERNRRLR